VILAAPAGIVIGGLVSNAGHHSRNYRLYGHPLSTAPGYTNEELSGRIVLANVVRNSALHLDSPFRRVNSYGYRAMKRLLEDELNNPKSRMHQSDRFRSSHFTRTLPAIRFTSCWRRRP
jgi:hypothetical protein